MEKAFPCQEKVLFSVQKGERILKNPLGKAIFLEWRTKDQINVKVYDQKRTVDYADYKVGLFYISPFDLFVEGEPVITKVEKRRSNWPSK